MVSVPEVNLRKHSNILESFKAEVIRSVKIYSSWRVGCCFRVGKRCIDEEKGLSCPYRKILPSVVIMRVEWFLLLKRLWVIFPLPLILDGKGSAVSCRDEGHKDGGPLHDCTGDEVEATGPDLCSTSWYTQGMVDRLGEGWKWASSALCWGNCRLQATRMAGWASTVNLSWSPVNVRTEVSSWGFPKWRDLGEGIILNVILSSGDNENSSSWFMCANNQP